MKQGRAFSSSASASDKEQQQLLLRRVLRETHAAEVGRLVGLDSKELASCHSLHSVSRVERCMKHNV